MLVATAGHSTASYPTALHPTASSSGSSNLAADSPRRLCRDSVASTSQAALKSTTLAVAAAAAATPNNISHSVSAALPNGLLKTLSVRISRGTEFIKDTVQKALINTTSSSSSSAAFGPSVAYGRSTAVATASGSHVGKPLAPLLTSSTSSSSAATSATVASSSSLTATTSNTNSSEVRARLALTRRYVEPTEEYLRLYTLPPTRVHKSPNRDCNDVEDCMHKAHMCHFQPIHSEPTTAPKTTSRSRTIITKSPKAIVPPRVKVDFILQNPSLYADLCRKPSKRSAEAHEHSGQSPTPAEDLHNDENDDGGTDDDVAVIVYENYKPKPNKTTLPTLYSAPKHPSAFVYLIAHMRDITNARYSEEKAASMSERNAANGAKRKAAVRKTPTAAPSKATASKASGPKAKVPLKRLQAAKAVKTVKAKVAAATASTAAATPAVKALVSATPAAGVNKKSATTKAGRGKGRKSTAAATPKGTRKKAATTTKAKRRAKPVAAKKSSTKLVDMMQQAGLAVPRATESQLMHDARLSKLRAERNLASSSSTLNHLMDLHRAHNVDSLRVPASGKRLKPARDGCDVPPRKKLAKVEAVKTSTAASVAAPKRGPGRPPKVTPKIGDTLSSVEGPKAPAKEMVAKRKPARPRVTDTAARQPSLKRLGDRTTPPVTRSRGRVGLVAGFN